MKRICPLDELDEYMPAADCSDCPFYDQCLTGARVTRDILITREQSE